MQWKLETFTKMEMSTIVLDWKYFWEEIMKIANRRDREVSVASDHNLVAHYKALSVFVAIIQSSAR
jgi:hypothetical protein